MVLPNCTGPEKATLMHHHQQTDLSWEDHERSTSFKPHPSRLGLVLVRRAGRYLATGRRGVFWEDNMEQAKRWAEKDITRLGLVLALALKNLERGEHGDGHFT